MFNSNPTGKRKQLTQKYAGHLFILAGVLFVLPSIFGDGESDQIAIGIMFIVLGIVFNDKKEKANESDCPDSD